MGGLKHIKGKNKGNKAEDIINTMVKTQDKGHQNASPAVHE